GRRSKRKRKNTPPDKDTSTDCEFGSLRNLQRFWEEGCVRNQFPFQTSQLHRRPSPRIVICPVQKLLGVLVGRVEKRDHDLGREILLLGNLQKLFRDFRHGQLSQDKASGVPFFFRRASFKDREQSLHRRRGLGFDHIER